MIQKNVDKASLNIEAHCIVGAVAKTCHNNTENPVESNTAHKVVVKRGIFPIWPLLYCF